MGFRDPYINPNLSEDNAKAVRNACIYNIFVDGRKLYNCCISHSFENYYNTESISVEFDKNWKKNFFKLPTWKACVHCQVGVDSYKITNPEIELGCKEHDFIDYKTRVKVTKIKGHE
jgi:hypothetical protein